MARKKPEVPNPLTPERKAEIAAETQAALESARKSEEKRRESTTTGKPDVNAKVKTTPIKGTERVAGQEDQGPSAAPKIKLKGPVVSTGKILARKGLRPPKRTELKRGVTAVQTEKNPTESRTRKRKKLTKTVVRDAATGRARQRRPEEFKRTELPAVQTFEPSKPRTLAPGAGARREKVFVDPSKPQGEQATKKLKGLAVPHKVIAPAVSQAMEHLRGMAATKGTPEYHEHVAAFNAIHPTILGMDPTIHHALGAMAHHTMYPKHDSHSVITQITAAIGDRLSEGRSMEVQRAQRQRGN